MGNTKKIDEYKLSRIHMKNDDLAESTILSLIHDSDQPSTKKEGAFILGKVYFR